MDKYREHPSLFKDGIDSANYINIIAFLCKTAEKPSWASVRVEWVSEPSVTFSWDKTPAPSRGIEVVGQLNCANRCGNRNRTRKFQQLEIYCQAHKIKTEQTTAVKLWNTYPLPQLPTETHREASLSSDNKSLRAASLRGAQQISCLWNDKGLGHDWTYITVWGGGGSLGGLPRCGCREENKRGGKERIQTQIGLKRQLKGRKVAHKAVTARQKVKESDGGVKPRHLPFRLIVAPRCIITDRSWSKKQGRQQLCARFWNQATLRLGVSSVNHRGAQNTQRKILAKKKVQVQLRACL